MASGLCWLTFPLLGFGVFGAETLHCLVSVCFGEGMYPPLPLPHLPPPTCIDTDLLLVNISPGSGSPNLGNDLLLGDGGEGGVGRGAGGAG